MDEFYSNSALGSLVVTLNSKTEKVIFSRQKIITLTVFFENKGYKTIHCAIILRSDSHTQTLPPNVNRGRTLNQG